MKKFILKSSIFFIALVSVYFLLSFITSKKEVTKNDYMASIIDKHKYANSISTPKVILVGGSNLAFGIDSEKIENRIHRKVVNLGIHAGLGLEFMLNEAKDVSKKGDVIFLSPEYFLSKEGNYKLKKLTSSYYPNANQYFDSDWLQDLKINIDKTRADIKNFSFKRKKQTNKKIQHKETSLEKVIYSRYSFNSHGDVIKHLSFNKPKELKDRVKLEYKYWDGIELINKFNEYATANDIKVYYLFSTYPITEFKKNKEVILKLEQDLHRDLTVKILNKPTDFVYSDFLFFDTINHLDSIGREKRTDRLAQIVDSVINSLN